MRRFSFLLVAALLVPRFAVADDDLAKARKLFADGVHAYQAGDWEGARTLFREADEAHHAPAIVYNIGLTEEKLGHPQAAVEAYEKYIAEAGDSAEFGGAAIAAIAQLKARSTKLRVESKPPGARVFVDGTPLVDPTPATVLVSAGHHVVVVQGDTFREERDFEAKGGGESQVLAVDAPAPPVAPPPPAEPEHHASPVAPPPQSTPPQSPPPQPRRPDEVVWGAEFAFVPAYMLGVTTANANNRKPAPSIVAGPLLELGYALTDRFEFLGRALGGLGPDGKPSYAWMVGPGLSAIAIPSRLWIGATFIAGQLETRAGNPKVRYGTDIVFGTLAEANVVILDKPSGQWLAGIQPAFLLTEMHNDNTTIFVPLTFGYRGY